MFPSHDHESKNLKPIKVQLQVSYILTFTEPDASLNIPMPIQPKSSGGPSLQQKLAYLQRLARYLPYAVAATGAHYAIRRPATTMQALRHTGRALRYY